MTSERELQRLVERWQQLPLDQALSRMPVVRPVVQQLADSQLGTPLSHGCLRMAQADAKFVWDWSTIGTTVYVTDLG